MTKTEQEAILSRLEYHAKETSQAARTATLEAFNGRRTALEESRIQCNVAEANCKAVEAQYWYLRALRLLDGES